MTMRKAVFVMNSQGNILQGIVKDAKEFERSCQEQEGGKKKKENRTFFSCSECFLDQMCSGNKQ